MRRHQSGLLGLIELIAIGVAAAAAITIAVVAWHNFTESYRNEGRNEQLEKDKPVLEQVKTERDAAKKQAVDALSDVAACTEAVKTQSDLVSLWQSRAQENFKAAAKARADAQAAHVASQTAVQRYVEIVNRPPVKDQTCQQKLDATDKLLRDAARARAAAKAGK